MDHDRAPDEEMDQLQGLRVTAPKRTFLRFRHRAGLMQGGKLLLESQVAGFWLVFDTFLKRIFRAVPVTENTIPQDHAGEKA